MANPIRCDWVNSEASLSNVPSESPPITYSTQQESHRIYFCDGFQVQERSGSDRVCVNLIRLGFSQNRFFLLRIEIRHRGGIRPHRVIFNLFQQSRKSHQHNSHI
jgi:hypothetical protein